MYPEREARESRVNESSSRDRGAEEGGIHPGEGRKGHPSRRNGGSGEEQGRKKCCNGRLYVPLTPRKFAPGGPRETRIPAHSSLCRCLIVQ